jgi:succinate dehydrogenase flavin-adding protein (antitoxin of CptAB toxin-antitoxin module)
LDVVLTRFLETNYETLSDAQIRDFDALLDAQDTNLWYMLIGKEKPESPSIQTILAKISFRDNV